MKDNKFVFVTGAPGSAWSMISHRFKKNVKNFDFTDENDNREYDLPEEHKKEYDIKVDNWKAKTHMGAYFGPHHEFGHSFDDLSKYDSNVENFYIECLRPFSDHTSPYKLVKSHWFSYNLDWLWDNCKGHELLLIWREPEAAKDWWYRMGGWNIHYPVYTWYDNPERMWLQMQEESKLILDFGNKMNVTWHDYDTNDSWLEKEFGEGRKRDAAANPKFKDTIKIGYLRIS
jgi:hypothetical protein